VQSVKFSPYITEAYVKAFPNGFFLKTHAVLKKSELTPAFLLLKLAILAIFSFLIN
jgi:hypothetical protein